MSSSHRTHLTPKNSTRVNWSLEEDSMLIRVWKTFFDQNVRVRIFSNFINYDASSAFDWPDLPWRNQKYNSVGIRTASFLQKKNNKQRIEWIKKIVNIPFPIHRILSRWTHQYNPASQQWLQSDPENLLHFNIRR